jgi:peptide chain release factor subunit 3
MSSTLSSETSTETLTETLTVIAASVATPGEENAKEIEDDLVEEEGSLGKLSGKKNLVVDDREHLNVIFIGHVDAGKSTLSGSILFQSGQVDTRMIEKFKREAKAHHLESWFLAYIMDTNEEERAKGKTVEVGRAFFETSNRRFTILDAPGHKGYVTNMIQGACQADIGVLVISARKGEFETGFEKSGQTREHALLAKTLGVRHLIVAVNKMDDPLVNWSKERYDEIVSKVSPFLKNCGYNIKKGVYFLPCSALNGHFVKDKTPCPFYDGPSIFDLLNELSVPRDSAGPLRIPVIAKYVERGLVSMGKVESGTITTGQDVVVMPIHRNCKVEKIFVNEDTEIPYARSGENICIRLKGIQEEEIQRGFVICDSKTPCPAVTRFQAQLVIIDLPESRPIMSAGYECVLHIHTAEEECVIDKIVAELGKEKTSVPPRFVRSGSTSIVNVRLKHNTCIEKYDLMQQMGRFTLRDEAKTIAIGKVIGLPASVAVSSSSMK